MEVLVAEAFTALGTLGAVVSGLTPAHGSAAFAMTLLFWTIETPLGTT